MVIKTPWGSDLTEEELSLVDELAPKIQQALQSTSSDYEEMRAFIIRTRGYSIFREAQSAAWFLLFGKS